MDNELNLAEYVQIVWRRRSLIAGVVLAAILSAAILSVFVLRPVYEAEGLLMISDVRFQAFPPNPVAKTEPAITADNLIPVVHNEVVASTVAASVRGLVDASPRELVERVRVSRIRGTNLLTVRARGSTPGSAVAIASAWSEAIVRHVDVLSMEDTQRTLSLVEQVIASAAKDLTQSEKALSDFQATTKLPVLEQRVEETVRRIAYYEARLGEIEHGGARTGGEVILQPSGRTYTLSVSPIREPGAIREILAALNGGLSRHLQALAIEKQRSAQLVRQVDLKRSTHLTLVQKREEMRVLLGTNSGRVTIAVPAQMPLSPAGPRKALNVVLAGILGLIAGTILAFVSHYFGGLAATFPRQSAEPVFYPRGEKSDVQS